jgi:hypothetical protein
MEFELTDKERSILINRLIDYSDCKLSIDIDDDSQYVAYITDLSLFYVVNPGTSVLRQTFHSDVSGRGDTINKAIDNFIFKIVKVLRNQYNGISIDNTSGYDTNNIRNIIFTYLPDRYIEENDKKGLISL